MTTDELNTIVAAVVAELEKSGVDFDYKIEAPLDTDTIFVIRGTAPNYQGVTVTWKGLLDIITAQATQAKTDAVNAKDIAQQILTQVQSKGTEITNFVAISKTEIETQKNESVNAVKSVYQSDFNELKGDLAYYEKETYNLFNPYADSKKNNVIVTNTKDSVTVTSATEGTFKDVEYIINVENINSVRIYYGEISGNGSPKIRIGYSEDGVNFSNWISGVSENGEVFDVSSYSYIVFSLYAVFDTNSGKGNYIVYKNLMIVDNSVSDTKYIPHSIFADFYARDKINEIGLYNSTYDNIRSVAHRGYSEIAPENTAIAYYLAKKYGFTYVETDVQVTSDGKYVCVHDSDLSRVTNGVLTGAVSTYTLAELQAVDFGIYKGSKWQGTKVLTFEDFILICKKLGLKPYIELKHTHSESDIDYYINYVRKMGILDVSIWRGGQYNTYLRSKDDKIVLARDVFITEEKFSEWEIYKPYFIHTDYKYITSEVVEMCHNHNIRIEAWTVNTKEQLDNLVNIGIDGVTTDGMIAGKAYYNQLVN